MNPKIITSSKRLKIFQINIQCISNKINNLEVLLIEEKPDIVSIAEHWSVKENIELMRLSDYKLVSYYCRTSHKNGGTAIYVKNTLRATNIDVSQLSEELNCEVCAVKISGEDLKVGVISVYRSPVGDFNLFLDKLTSVVQKCTDQTNSLFLCGDMNVDFNSMDSRPKSRFSDFLQCFNLNITSFEPTRIFTDISGKTSISLLDYILTDVDLKSCKTRIFEAHLADHKVVSLDYYYSMKSISSCDSVDKIRYVRQVTQKNLEELNVLIKNTSFEDVYVNSDIDFCFDTFVNIIKEAFTECCPLKRFFTKKGSKPWLSREIKQASLHLKDIYWLHSNIRSVESLKMYRTAKADYNQLLETSKKKYTLT